MIESEPMSEAVRLAYEKCIGLNKWKAPKKKRMPFRKRRPELYEQSLLDGLKVELIQRYGEFCMACKATENIVLDHIKSRYCGGGNDISNLQLLCDKCNFRKGLRTTDYRS